MAKFLNNLCLFCFTEQMKYFIRNSTKSESFYKQSDNFLMLFFYLFDNIIDVLF